MYLFWVRHFNDIDHLTPIVWKMHKENYPVAVYCLNPEYDISADYRLVFLRNQGIPIDYVYRAFNRHYGILQRILQSLYHWCFRMQKKSDATHRKHQKIPSLSSRVFNYIGTIVYKFARQMFYDQHWATSILRESKARALCFDHVMPKLFVVDALLRAAEDLGIPSFAMPHGVHLYTNENTKPKASDERRFKKFNRFDYVIVPNQLRKDFLIQAGILHHKIIVLGSARYCTEWMSQNDKIVPKMIDSQNDRNDKLKVVFMPSKPQCNVDLDRLATTCLALEGVDGIETMIKPHTRTGLADDVYQRLRIPVVPHMLTAELCSWADVILVIGSSVISEAIVRGKPALYLKYLHDNTTLFEEIGSCWTIHDETELKAALTTLQLNHADIPYSDVAIAQYMTNVVNGGKTGRDVLQEYTDFIVNHSKNPNDSQG